MPQRWMRAGLLALMVLWEGAGARLRRAAGRVHREKSICAGCLAHSALDIPVHADDGPLLLFPFEWSGRFQSPVSYWDLRALGREFTVFELLLELVLLVYLFGPGLRRRLRRGALAPQER